MHVTRKVWLRMSQVADARVLPWLFPTLSGSTWQLMQLCLAQAASTLAKLTSKLPIDPGAPDRDWGWLPGHYDARCFRACLVANNGFAVATSVGGAGLNLFLPRRILCSLSFGLG